MPHQFVLKTHMLELGFLIVLLACDGGGILTSSLSTTLKSSHSKSAQLPDSDHKVYPGSFKLLERQPNQRKLLSDGSHNESNAVKDDSIGAKIREFYADDNNMALFCVLPLLILLYGGCSVIYCVHKCKKNFKKRKQEHQQRSKSQTALSSDNVSLISGTENMSVRPKPNFRPFSSGSNRVTPAPLFEATSSSNIPPKLKLDPKSHVKDLLTDYEFFASWVMAQKTADLIQLQNEQVERDSSMSGAEFLSKNSKTTVGTRKKKLVFLS